MFNVIVNPIAGKGKASRVVKKVVKYLKSQNVEFLVFFSENNEDINNITKTLCKAGEKEFIIVGGDGTLHQFINGLTDPSKTYFGIVPAGTHNHFARYLKIPANPIDAIKNVLENTPIRIDYLKCNDYRVLNIISCGALELAERNFINQNDNKISHSKIVKQTLESFNGLQLSVEADNTKIKDTLYTSCAICNGGFYGDNMYISPLSNMHDGLANLVLINYQSENNIKADYNYIKKGTHIYIEPTSNSWTSHINIKSNQSVDVMLDNELYSFNEMEINVIPNGLNIYTKK